MDAKTSKIITIGRSYGAGGKTVGKMVAESLGIPYYDSELLRETAKNCSLSEKSVICHNKHLTQLDR